MTTTNPVPSNDPTDLLFNAQKLDQVVSGSTQYYTDRLGVNRRTVEGIGAAADVVLGGIGYAPPVTYASGISMTLTTQTVEYSGEIYAPKVASLPFTTSTWETDSAKFRLIQGVAATDLAASGGSSMIGYMPAGTGAVATTVQEKLWETVSRAEYSSDASFNLAKAGKIGIDGDTIVSPTITSPFVTGGTFTKSRTTGYYNIDPTKFSWWASALARHRSGNGQARIACIGDSTTSGVGSNPASATADSRRRAYPADMAAVLNATGNVKAQSNSIWCDGFEGANIGTFDPRLSLGSGWTIHPSLFCAGGKAFFDNTTTSSNMTFNPGVVTDTLDVYFVRYPGYAEFVVSTGGVFNGSGTTAGASGVGKATITRASSSSPWVIQKSTGTPNAPLLIVGLDAYVAADKPISVWNMGASGSRVADWTADNQPYSFVNAIQVFAPDLSIVNLTINDWSNLTDPATYKANLQQIITACKVSGDVLLAIGVPSNIGNATTAKQLEYAGYVYELAASNDLALVNLSERWISQSYRPDRNFYYDGLHPSNAGYQDVAHAFAKIIANP